MPFPWWKFVETKLFKKITCATCQQENFFLVFFAWEITSIYMHVSMMEALEITHVAGDSSTNPIEDKRDHAWELLFWSSDNHLEASTCLRVEGLERHLIDKEPKTKNPTPRLPQYRRFIAGPTLNNSKKRSWIFLEIIT